MLTIKGHVFREHGREKLCKAQRRLLQTNLDAKGKSKMVRKIRREI